MPPVMFSVVTKYHKGRHSLFLYNSEIFYAFTQDILRSHPGFDVLVGITNQCAFYRLLVGLGLTGLPERSRFNRRCTAMGCLLQPLRVGLVWLSTVCHQ